MTNIQLSLFCLVDGESTPFPVEIESTKTIGDLKRAIKDDNSIAFADVDAKMLTLWHVSIPVLPKKDLKEISLAEEELDEKDDVSDVFKETPPKKTIHVIVQRPPQASTPLPSYLSDNSRPGTPLSDHGQILRTWNTRYRLSQCICERRERASRHFWTHSRFAESMVSCTRAPSRNPTQPTVLGPSRPFDTRCSIKESCINYYFGD
ncbi:hypothetical protein BGZ59_002058, partial [Podila verticillata]